MRNIKIRSTVLGLLLLLLVPLFSVALPAGISGDLAVPTVDLKAPTRADDIEINTTYRVTQSTTFGAITIREGGKLIIEGSISIVADTLECNNHNSTLFQMKGAGEADDQKATLTLRGGICELKPHTIILEDAVLSVFSENETDDTSPVPGESIAVTLNSMGGPLYINNTDISVRARDGLPGTTEFFGTRGGRAVLGIRADPPRNLYISDSDIYLKGGKGGDAKVSGNLAGAGGDASLLLYGNELEIRKSNILCEGGGGGTPPSGGDSSQGAKGGGAYDFKITANRDINIYSSDIEARGGLSTERTGERDSRLRIVSEEGGFYVDDDKSPDEEMESLSSLIGRTTTIEAPLGGYLHEVDLGDSVPTAQVDTLVRVYWWFTVNVRDNYNDPLPNAVIKYRIGIEPETYQSEGEPWATDENGEFRIELESLVIHPDEPANERYYTFYAVITGGAEGNSDSIQLKNENRVADIEITRLEMDIVTINNKEFTEGMVVGGVVQIQGYARPAPNSGNTIQSLFISYRLSTSDEYTEIGPATDTSDDIAPPYSVWELTWETERIPDGDYVLRVTGSDEAYTVSVYRDVEVSQRSINHRPQLASVSIKDTTGTKQVPIRGDVDVHVTREEPFINISGSAWEPDARSPYLETGKEVVTVILSLVRFDGTQVYSKELDAANQEEIIKVNETGGYSFKYRIDTNEKVGNEFIYKEGSYRFLFMIEDNAGLVSSGSWFNMTLQKDFFPVIRIFLNGDYPAPTDKDWEFDDPVFGSGSTRDEQIWTEESDTIVLSFNLTNCYDTDDLTRNLQETWRGLTYTVTYKKTSTGDSGEIITDQEGIPEFTHTFNVGNKEKNTYESFILTFTVKDTQGLESKEVYVVKIYHDPPPEEHSLFTLLFGVEVDVDFGSVFFAFPAVFLVLSVLFIGITLFFIAKNKREKDRKVALLEKVRADERNKKGGVIEDEILHGRGFIKSSSDYLEATGASKGKEEFQKQLQGGSQVQQGKPLSEDEPQKIAAPQEPAPAAGQTSPQRSGQEAGQKKEATVTGQPPEQQPPAQKTIKPSPPSAAGPPSPPPAPPSPPKVQAPAPQQPQESAGASQQGQGPQ